MGREITLKRIEDGWWIRRGDVSEGCYWNSERVIQIVVAFLLKYPEFSAETLKEELKEVLVRVAKEL